MIRFHTLEQAGVTVAAMSDRVDGDCSAISDNAAHTETLLRRLGVFPDQLARARQTHGTAVCVVSSSEGDRANMPEADGLATNLSSVALGITVADCAPLFLYDPVNRAVALLHAGREGTRKNIAGIGVALLQRLFSSDPKKLVALIGPRIGVCCYEVSESLAADWKAGGLPARGRRLDLGSANRAHLENAGVIRHNIEMVPHCTVCGGDFFSYRAGDTSKRNLAIMML